jgi:prepilin-type N-terminal cleavage/methylation domain-containing protein
MRQLTENKGQICSMGRLRQQRGFTLVELAIVVTIIAILTVAILQGQSIVFNARVASTMSIAHDLSVASQTFKNRFHYLPGDLPNPGNYIPNLPPACIALTAPGTPNLGDGQILPPTESLCAVEELFQLGLIKADPDPSNPPYHMLQNPFTSGTIRLVAVSAVAANYPAVWPTTTANLIEFQNLPCEAVIAVDTSLDDGILNSGKAMASVPTCQIGAGITVQYFAMSLN